MSLKIPFFGGKSNLALNMTPKVFTITNLSADFTGPVLDDSRTIQFPAFLKGDIAESLQPNWSPIAIFGRVDSVAKYTYTERTLQFNFIVVALRDDEFKEVLQATIDARKGGTLSTLLSHGATLRQLGSAYKAGRRAQDTGFKSAAANRDAASHLSALLNKASGPQTLSIDYINKYFDSITDVDRKVGFLRKLVYPKQTVDGVYVSPPLVSIDLTENFKNTKGYITSLNVSHLLESGAGIDVLGKSFRPLAYDISINFTVLHDKSPNNNLDRPLA